MTKLPGFRPQPINHKVESSGHSSLRAAMNDDIAIGPGRMATYALGIWPESVVSRKTLRALLPRGGTKWCGAQKRWKEHQAGNRGRYNIVSKALQETLKKLEDARLIQRGDEFVRIVDQRALFDRALRDIHDPTHRKFLQLDEAVAEIEQQLAEERRPEILRLRRRELQIIRELMQPNTMNGRDSRRRLVRQEAGAINIPLGATTGHRPMRQNPPAFPVTVQEDALPRENQA